jgi:hypothetical protein
VVRGLDEVGGGLVLVPRNNSISLELAMSPILLGFEREGEFGAGLAGSRTHSKQIETFQSLPWHNSHHFHFT